MPAAAPEDFEGVLRLQIENEFPLPPDELAWGWRDVSSGAARREILVAAIRKIFIDDFASVLLAAGANPEFTVAALARDALCPQRDEAHAILEIGKNHSELVAFENGVPGNVRIFPTENNLADAVLKNTDAKIIYISGSVAAQDEIIQKLSARRDCRRLEISGGEGFSAATTGLKKSVSESSPLLYLSAKAKPAKTFFNFSLTSFSRPENRQWLVRAAALLAVLLLFPLAEMLLVKPFLNWRLNSFKARQTAFLSVEEPERKFLLYLKQNQPPYLDAFYIFSKSAPPGCHLDSISINQRGEFSVKATLPSAQAVTDFRAKIMASGFFANLAVEEQSPVPNQPKVSARMTANWRPNGMRAAVNVPPPVDKNGTNKSGGTNLPPAKPQKS